MRQPLGADDRAMGQRLTRYREALAVSQESLALLMRDAGHAWRQETVYRVENGRRVLRLNEAMVLADLFRVSLDELTGRGGGSPETGAAYARLLEVRRGLQELAARERELVKLVT